MSKTDACKHFLLIQHLPKKDSRDWAMAMVFYTIQNTWRCNILAEVVARVCDQSEVAINKRHKGKCISEILELGFLRWKSGYNRN